MKGASWPGSLVVGLGLTGSAMASTPPSMCRTASEQREFQLGASYASSIVQSALDTLDDCTKTDAFTSAVLEGLDALDIPPASDRSATCSVAGFLAGTEEAIDRGYGRCDLKCMYKGVLMAQVGSKLYCDLSIRLGGLVPPVIIRRPPVSGCGVHYETACDAEFLGHAQRYPQCRPYTTGRFASVFEAVRDSQCTYAGP